ncbi:MAG: TrkA family potassium uptake protein [Candidatus Cloacimonadota bacterium]|nr:TrkA family potassium uptake protein [Candidatus Cloacimonadota bacterium]
MYIIIAGAGSIGFAVTKALIENNHDVVVIDKDRDACEYLFAETGAVTINDSATNIKVLKNAGAQKADTLVCLMRNDADNISCALLAKSLGLTNVVARLRREQYEQAYKIAGIHSIVNMSEIVGDRILVEVEKPKMKKIFTLGVGKAGVYAFIIHENSCVEGMTIQEISQNKDFPEDCIFVGIFKKRNENFLIPRGQHIIDIDDTVFIMSKIKYIDQVTKFLNKKN